MHFVCKGWKSGNGPMKIVVETLGFSPHPLLLRSRQAVSSRGEYSLKRLSRSAAGPGLEIDKMAGSPWLISQAFRAWDAS